MANRTVSYAQTIHGTNPQYLIEKIIRLRIYESRYWKEHCTLLNSALVLEKAVDHLRYVGGVYGEHIKPSPFLCLALKLLQIQPQKEIIYLYIEQTDFKYLRALGAFYLRLVGSPVEIYKKLEPLLADYRKIRTVDKMRKFNLTHMDELIDSLLREERVFDVILPRMTKRIALERKGDLEPYKSELDEHLIPTQMIKEKVEQKVEEERRYNRRFRDDHSDYKERHYSSRGYRNKHEQDIHDLRNSRQRSYDKKESRNATSSGKIGRFRREDIDNENAIRAKLGLKPLK